MTKSRCVFRSQPRWMQLRIESALKAIGIESAAPYEGGAKNSSGRLSGSRNDRPEPYGAS